MGFGCLLTVKPLEISREKLQDQSADISQEAYLQIGVFLGGI
jgi:hypothetical protein